MTSFTTAYLAPEGYEQQLEKELGQVQARYGRLFLTNQPPQKAFWAQNIWYHPVLVSFSSISEAASILKNKQRNWALYPHTEHRRAALIKEKLPYISEKLLDFPAVLPRSPMGSWMLINKQTLLYSAECSSLYPNGELHFKECKNEPPSRAYLKLWEALSLYGKMPQPGEKCLEIGASPGGWTWVLAKLGAQVHCVDRSELAPQIAAMPGVHFKNGNAFGMTPKTVGAVDWIFSDVACYPEKLYEWVNEWLESKLCRHFICTLKFQGNDSYESVRLFANIPGSRIVHLSYNKHELTWFWKQEE